MTLLKTATAIALALASASLSLAAAPARAQEVLYSCYDANGNLRQRGVSRSFALGYLGYRGASEDAVGQLRSSRGVCVPQAGAGSGLSPAAIAVLRRCQARVAEHFQNLPANEIAVAPGRVDASGNATVNWRTQAGAQGTCSVDRTGAIAGFAVQGEPVAPAATSPSPPSPTAPEPVTTAANDRQRAFGNVAGIGDFTVLRATYRDSNAVRQFDAVVNGERQRWWANCRTEAIGRDRQAAPINDATRAVHGFVCTDRF